MVFGRLSERWFPSQEDPTTLTSLHGDEHAVGAAVLSGKEGAVMVEETADTEAMRPPYLHVCRCHLHPHHQDLLRKTDFDRRCWPVASEAQQATC
jgi:hypothetical protein